MKTPSDATIKKTLKALDTQSRTQSQPERLTLTESQKAMGKLLASQLVKAGFDTGKTEKILKADEARFNRLLAQRKAAALKQARKAKPGFKKAIKSQHAGLSSLAGTVANPVYNLLDKPFIIVPTNGLQYPDWQVASLDSFAKFSFAGGGTALENVNFYYLWRNPTDKYAVINIDTYFVLNGYISAGSDGGIFPFNRYANVYIAANLKPIELWNHPETSPAYQPTARQIAGIINIDTSGPLSGSNFDSRTISDGYPLYHQLFLVPPQSAAAFNVSVDVSYGTGEDSGRVEVDFASGDFGAISPYVLVTILT